MALSKILFLDRDGIINIDHGYVYQKKQFEFIEEIFEIALYYQKKDYKIIVVTNQSGIGRGYYTKKDFLDLTSWMTAEFQKKGVLIHHVYFCPHKPSDNCRCRKPRTGMIDDAAKDFKIDLHKSIMIGDKRNDIEFAKNANIETSIYIGYEKTVGATFTFPSITEFKQKMIKR